MAVSYAGQGWYDDELTWSENYEAFLALQKEDTYTIGDFTSTIQGDMEMYTDLKVRSAQEVETIADFYVARDEARAILSAQQATDVEAFNILWQAKEDNGYDVDYTP